MVGDFWVGVGHVSLAFAIAITVIACIKYEQSKSLKSALKLCYIGTIPLLFGLILIKNVSPVAFYFYVFFMHLTLSLLFPLNILLWFYVLIRKVAQKLRSCFADKHSNNVDG